MTDPLSVILFLGKSACQIHESGSESACETKYGQYLCATSLRLIITICCGSMIDANHVKLAAMGHSFSIVVIVN